MAWILGVLVAGLIIGALGRLVVPGPNPMGCVATSAVGIGGAIIGGVIGRLVFGHYVHRGPLTLALAVVGSALIIWLLQHHRHRVG
ncbi:MAG TPA: hypothetical protein VFA11_01355 [Acidimicrobiales bacterium]|nr:hypothetical protein [Acidimicrobiales bacterium]